MVPVRPRALILGLLGDYVRCGSGEIRLKSLVTISEQLGVAPSTIRVSRKVFCAGHEGLLRPRIAMSRAVSYLIIRMVAAILV